MEIVISFIGLIIVVVLLNKLFKWDAHPRSQQLRELAESQQFEYLKVGHLHLQADDTIPLFLQSGQYQHVQHLGQGQFQQNNGSDTAAREIKFFDYALFSSSLAGKAFSILNLSFEGRFYLRVIPKGTLRILEVKGEEQGWKHAQWLNETWQSEARQLWTQTSTSPEIFTEELKKFIADYPDLILEFLPGQFWIYRLGELIDPEEVLPYLTQLSTRLNQLEK